MFQTKMEKVSTIEERLDKEVKLNRNQQEADQPKNINQVL